MNGQTRMSPMTALFIGLFGVGAVGIACGTVVMLYGLRIVDGKATTLLSIAESAIGDLPELIESLPPAIENALSDRRAPEYASLIEIKVDFTPARSGGVNPVLTIVNKGDEVVSLLAVRVAAVDSKRVAVRDWTEVVATPLTFDEHWRGPIMPHSTRHVVLAGRWPVEPLPPGEFSGVVEIADIRIWRPGQGSIRSASAIP